MNEHQQNYETSTLHQPNEFYPQLVGPTTLDFSLAGLHIYLTNFYSYLPDFASNEPCENYRFNSWHFGHILAKNGSIVFL